MIAGHTTYLRYLLFLLGKMIQLDDRMLVCLQIGCFTAKSFNNEGYTLARIGLVDLHDVNMDHALKRRFLHITHMQARSKEVC